ncbi:MAG: 50S ribosomal protein L35 [Candidatus Buchananbacteria bacterium]
MKLKTHQTTSKKVRVTKGKGRKNKKYMTKHTGQDHFNARETGKTTRHKRKDSEISKADLRNVKRLLPYS